MAIFQSEVKMPQLIDLRREGGGWGGGRETSKHMIREEGKKRGRKGVKGGERKKRQKGRTK